MLAYDVAICLNAWCFETDHSYNVTKGRALLQAYAKVRPMTDAEMAAMPLLARGAAMRFLLTRARRLAERAARRAGAAESRRRNISASCVSTRRRKACTITASRRGNSREPAAKMLVCRTSSSIPTAPVRAIPGPGGWGAILQFGDHTKELKGGEAHTTNNRMELMAAISALEALKKPCRVDLHTDSQYVRNGISGWINGWKKNGWRTADKKPVKNADLWQRLDAAVARSRGQVALGQGPCRA